MFTQFHTPPTLYGDILDFYLVNGWFRSGQYIYTTKILNLEGKLYSPIRIRLPLVNYEFRKKLRKIWNRNQRFETIYRKAFISREKEELYQKHKLRFEGYISQTIKDSLQDGGETTIYDTYEVAVYDGGKLVAVSFFDLGEKSMASIMGLFDPDYAKYSLGFYTMLAEINYGKKQGFEYYYPGYVIPDYPKFDYKLRIGDCEFYKAAADQWLPFGALEKKDLPSEIIENQLVTLGEALESEDINYQIFYYPHFDKGYTHQVGELIELSSPLFIQLQLDNIIGQNLVIEYNLQKQCYELSQYHGFLQPIQNLHNPSPHDKYDTYRTLLLRQVVLIENKNCKNIVSEVLKISKFR
ncbi:MAG: GNAT family N-acetyltransferase [Bacteroidota bacterium]